MSVNGILFCESSFRPDIVVPRDFKTIKEATEKGMAGDRILVKAGTYEEKDGFRLKTDMKLIGEGPDRTYIRVGGEGIVISEKYDKLYNVTIDNLNLHFERMNLHVTYVDGFTLRNCLLTSNSQLFLLTVDSSVNVRIINCTFANSAGGINIWWAPVEMSIVNSLFYNNKVGIETIAPFQVEDSGMPLPERNENDIRGDVQLTLSHNDFWNVKDFEGCRKGDTDLAADPKLANPTGGDFHLSGNSPCINAGDPDPKYNDPDGSRSDIGAFPFSKKK